MGAKVFLAGNVFNFDRVKDALDDEEFHLIIGPKTPPGTRLSFDGVALLSLFSDVDAIVTSPRETYTREVLEAATHARVVVSPVIGVENIDVDAATSLGLPVAYGAYPENYLGVSEAAVAMMVTLMKRLRRKERAVREGRWGEPPYGNLMLGKTIGLIGFGRIGSAVASRLQGWDMQVVVYDPYADPSALEAVGAIAVSLDTLLGTADIVSLHSALTDETREIIGEEELGLMKPTAYLLNLARGGLIDQPALIKALTDGRIAGVALDVFATEPLEQGSELRDFDPDQVIMTPHNAGYGEENISAGISTTINNLKRGLDGQEPLYVVNPQVQQMWQERLSQLDLVKQ